MPFGVVSGVGLGIRVFNGHPRPLRRRGDWGDFRITGLNGVFFAQKCIRLVREKLTIFPYELYIVGNDGSLAFRRYSQARGRRWGLREICKHSTASSMF